MRLNSVLEKFKIFCFEQWDFEFCHVAGGKNIGKTSIFTNKKLPLIPLLCIITTRLFFGLFRNSWLSKLIFTLSFSYPLKQKSHLKMKINLFINSSCSESIEQQYARIYIDNNISVGDKIILGYLTFFLWIFELLLWVSHGKWLLAVKLFLLLPRVDRLFIQFLHLLHRFSSARFSGG